MLICEFCGLCVWFCVRSSDVTGVLSFLYVLVWVFGVLWFLCVFLCEFVVSV